MSATIGMQTICGSTAFSRTGLSQFSAPSKYVLPLTRNTKFQVRSMSEEGEKEQAGAAAPPPPMPSLPPKHKVKTGFFDVLAFSGPAPERINGRLAMIGFVVAIGAELASGQDIFSQLQNGGVPSFLGISVLLTIASLIPMFKGVTAESKSGDLMSSDAEIWNGRFAMLGLVALAFTEFVKGGALV